MTVNAGPAWSLYTPWQRWGLLTLLFLVTTSNYFDYYVLTMVLEPIKREFQVSDTLLGLLSGFCFALIYAIAGLPIARWADRGNRRTVLAVTLAAWSVTTIACGLARSFWQLALARAGLGATQPGAMPTAQSLVADYFPPQRRATAIAVLTSGSSLGYLFGVVLGGAIAATYGWRSTFLFGGVAGLALAVVARLGLTEPREQLGFPGEQAPTESARESLAQLTRRRSFIWILVGTTVYHVFAHGVNTFLPSFMMRSLHATLAQVSLTWGLVMVVATLTGALGGGWMADRLSRRDIRWYVWLPMATCLLGALLYWLALSMRTLWGFMGLEFVAGVGFGVGVPVSFAAVQTVCGHQRRAIATAIVYFSISLLGGGFGPLLAGMLSDAFQQLHGNESLRDSLMLMLVFLVPAAVAFLQAGRTLRAEQED